MVIIMVEAYNKYITELIGNFCSPYDSEIREKTDEISKINKEIYAIKYDIEHIHGLFKKSKEKKLSKLMQTKKQQKLEISAELDKLYNSRSLTIPRYPLIQKGYSMKPKTLETAYNLLIDRNIPFSLTSDDIEYTYNNTDPNKYTDISDFVCVHKTNYMPKNGMLSTSSDATLKTNSVQILGKTYTYQYSDNSRETIHFSLNNEVGDHPYGSWQECKYAYIIPFEDLPKKQLAAFNPVDTYYSGSIKLPSSTIFLCPEEEKEKIQNENPELNIIAYKGKNNVSGFANFLVEATGYQIETSSMWAWHNDYSQQQAMDIAKKEGFRTDTHSFSYEHVEERAKSQIGKLLPILDILRKNNLVNSSNISIIAQELSKQNIVEINFGNEDNLLQYLNVLGLVDSEFNEEFLYMSKQNKQKECSIFLIESTLANIANEDNLDKSVNKSL